MEIDDIANIANAVRDGASGVISLMRDDLFRNTQLLISCGCYTAVRRFPDYELFNAASGLQLICTWALREYRGIKLEHPECRHWEWGSIQDVPVSTEEWIMRTISQFLGPQSPLVGAANTE